MRSLHLVIEVVRVWPYVCGGLSLEGRPAGVPTRQSARGSRVMSPGCVCMCQLLHTAQQRQAGEGWHLLREAVTPKPRMPCIHAPHAVNLDHNERGLGMMGAHMPVQLATHQTPETDVPGSTEREAAGSCATVSSHQT